MRHAKTRVSEYQHYLSLSTIDLPLQGLNAAVSSRMASALSEMTRSSAPPTVGEVTDRTRVFADYFDRRVTIDPPGSEARFGRDVLGGLTTGIDEFIASRQPRWECAGSIGPVLLASSMFLDDAELIQRLRRLSSVCVVITKQGRGRLRDKMSGVLNEKGKRLHDCVATAEGLPTAVLPGLRDLAERVNGKPLVVGPSWNPIADELTIPPIRTLGFRPQNPRDTPPILHAKLALLGRTWLREFDTPFGSYEQYGFEPKRLWISSANFTESSRRSLEFGYWSEDMHLMETVQAFLVELIAASEPLEPDSDIFDPQFAPVDYDDQAFIEALRDIEPDDDDDW